MFMFIFLYVYVYVYYVPLIVLIIVLPAGMSLCGVVLFSCANTFLVQDNFSPLCESVDVVIAPCCRSIHSSRTPPLTAMCNRQSPSPPHETTLDT